MCKEEKNLKLANKQCQECEFVHIGKNIGHNHCDCEGYAKHYGHEADTTTERMYVYQEGEELFVEPACMFFLVKTPYLEGYDYYIIDGVLYCYGCMKYNYRRVKLVLGTSNRAKIKAGVYGCPECDEKHVISKQELVEHEPDYVYDKEAWEAEISGEYDDD